ncbi:arginase family protein [Magnetospirillum sp. UT-4]|uniref:arginase family protein n=1 Tax=Magnetospirillum sp. UT-4 TaxID=2681467 RepID=UPI00137D2BD1|nr:arginase family protein [Magnetospirillum sp. UT-4]CAA7626470.1 conserved hypothetical protein [Magnetospirillum sp. UT-4]
MKLRILHLDGSLMAQPTLARLAEEGAAQVVNLKPEAQALRLWTGRADMVALARRLAEEGPPPGRGADVTFMGSGDYHHLSVPLIARHAGRPLSVLHFDNHPDWGRWPPAYHCGSWVNRALELDAVAKVVTVGPCAPAGWPQLKGANLGLLGQGRYELHPWRMGRSRRLGGGPVDWANLGEGGWDGFVATLADRLPTERVYVTIDKDVLHADEAVTNWDQGEMRLDHILACLRVLAGSHAIVGIDVCGEYAPPRFDGWGKRLLARLDQPRPPPQPDLGVNEAANRRLLAAVAELGL